MRKIIIVILLGILYGCSSIKQKNREQCDSTIVTVIDTIKCVSEDNALERERELESTSGSFTNPIKIIKNDVSKGVVRIKRIRNNNIRRETADISIGRVIYQTPDTMVVLVESKVIVRISKGKLNEEQVVDGLSGSVNVVPINVTSKMEVRLVDPSPESAPSFNIKSVNKSEQIIEDEVYTEWQFTVVPLKSGNHELKLVVSMIKGDLVKEETWSDTIKVKSNVTKEVLGFWEKYWQWLFTTIIIPIIIFFWKKKKKEN